MLAVLKELTYTNTMNIPTFAPIYLSFPLFRARLHAVTNYGYCVGGIHQRPMLTYVGMLFKFSGN